MTQNKITRHPAWFISGSDLYPMPVPDGDIHITKDMQVTGSLNVSGSFDIDSVTIFAVK